MTERYSLGLCWCLIAGLPMSPVAMAGGTLIGHVVDQAAGRPLPARVEASGRPLGSERI